MQRIILFILNTRLFKRMEFPVFCYLLKKNIKIATKEDKPRLFWGPVPILNNKYWSKALSKEYSSKTVMTNYYDAINTREDFDLYMYDIIESFTSFPKFLVWRYKEYFLMYYLLKNFDIFHIPFSGTFLGNTPLWNKEQELFKLLNKKTVLLPYGADAYLYSRIKNESFQQALLISYPEAARNEAVISERLMHWSKYADFIPAGFMIDGFPRWDAVVGNFVTVSDSVLEGEKHYNNGNGSGKPVVIVHCPNHRGAKGTEFIVAAVNELKNEGFNIDFRLLERLQNTEILKILKADADILVEQLIMGYGLNAIEGMASGVATVSNLDNECYTRLFRRYGSLNECPIVSATPENIKSVLKILILDPKLRETIGKAGKKFALKYHSEDFARYLFGKIYDKIWYGKNVDTSSLFHPMRSDSYNNLTEKVRHPLVENKIVA